MQSSRRLLCKIHRRARLQKETQKQKQKKIPQLTFDVNGSIRNLANVKTLKSNNFSCFHIYLEDYRGKKGGGGGLQCHPVGGKFGEGGSNGLHQHHSFTPRLSQ